LLHVKKALNGPEEFKASRWFEARGFFNFGLTIRSGDLQRLAPLKKTAKELRESRRIEKPCATFFSAGLFSFLRSYNKGDE
jgi:hypothetical protein